MQSRPVSFPRTTLNMFRLPYYHITVDLSLFFLFPFFFQCSYWLFFNARRLSRLYIQYIYMYLYMYIYIYISGLRQNCDEWTNRMVNNWRQDKLKRKKNGYSLYVKRQERRDYFHRQRGQYVRQQYGAGGQCVAGSDPCVVCRRDCAIRGVHPRILYI